MPLGEQEFETFIERLDAEAGMRRKLRLLAGSRSQLRELSAGQRQRLAVAIGNRWAWRNIESLFGNPSRLSDNQREVKEFFDSMREAEPEELLEIGKEMKRGEFAGAKGLVLEAVGEALDDDSEEEEGLPEDLDVVPEPSPAPPVVVVPPSERESETQQDPSPEAEPEPKPKEAAQSPSAEPTTVGPQRAKVEEVEPRDPGPAPARKPAVEQLKPRKQLRPDASGLSAGELMQLLRRLSAGELSSSRQDRAAMVGSLRSGWAARRAVSAMIRSHSVTDLDEALALIGQLPTATQQAWCLGDLIQLWDLDDTARRRVLAAAPTGATQRRLSRRVVRTGMDWIPIDT